MTYEEFNQTYCLKTVEQYPHQVENTVLVSVLIQTYQHREYIEKCLQSIIMQKTDFAFEVLLGEDDSSDGTREICIEYAIKYPDKIRLFLHHRANNMSIMDRPSGRFNFLYNFYNSRGRYIALCEGDDYWTDPYKLSKQVQLLEGEEKISMVIHNALEKFDDHSALMNAKTKTDSVVNKELILKQIRIPTLSILFRRSIITDQYLNILRHSIAADRVIELCAADSGKVVYLNQVWGVKHTLSTGLLSQMGKDKLNSYIAKYEMNEAVSRVMNDENGKYIHYYLAALAYRVYNYSKGKGLKFVGVALVNYLKYYYEYRRLKPN